MATEAVALPTETYPALVSVEEWGTRKQVDDHTPCVTATRI